MAQPNNSDNKLLTQTTIIDEQVRLLLQHMADAGLTQGEISNAFKTATGQKVPFTFKFGPVDQETPTTTKMKATTSKTEDSADLKEEQSLRKEN
jgi:hypothetical protein